MAWSRDCVLPGTSYRICLYLSPLCEIRCSGKDQLTDWKMSKDPDTCNGTVSLHFFETFEGAVLCSWTSFYFDQYFLCAVGLNRPQASPTMHELSLTTLQVEKIWQFFLLSFSLGEPYYSILFLLCGVFCIAIFLRSSF